MSGLVRNKRKQKLTCAKYSNYLISVIQMKKKTKTKKRANHSPYGHMDCKSESMKNPYDSDNVQKGNLLW